MRRAAKKDINHNPISDAFKQCGCSVFDTSRLGNDFPDMIIGLCGINVLVEIKRDDVPPSKSKLSDGQFRFFHEWKGWTAVVRNVDDVLNIVSQVKQERAQQMRGFAAMNVIDPALHQFVKDCLDQERFGFSISDEVRSAARLCLSGNISINEKG